MEAFVYRWIDTKTNKLYVGWHKGSADDGYICSSKIMLEEYNKRPGDFKREIVATGLAEDMVRLENHILIAENAKENLNYYNMHNGNGLYFLKGHAEETKRKISVSKKGIKRPDLSERNKTELNPAKLGLCSRNTVGDNNPMYGKKHTEEAKLKMSKNLKGKNTRPKLEETKQKMAEARRKYWAKKREELNGS